MALPQSFLSHLQLSGYDSRSNKHSNALGEAIVADLVAACPLIGQRASKGDVVYDLNFNLTYATATWNTDVVLGTPPPATGPPPSGQSILRATPSSAQIAIELKSIFTKHPGQAKNRKRDLEAHHEHVHNYNSRAIAGGVFIVNIARVYQSSLLSTPTTRPSIVNQVKNAIGEARAISVRGGPTGYGLDAMAVLVVDMDNMNLASTRYHTVAPAPPVGDPLHYDSFIQRMCSEYTQRFP